MAYGTEMVAPMTGLSPPLVMASTAWTSLGVAVFILSVTPSLGHFRCVCTVCNFFDWKFCHNCAV